MDIALGQCRDDAAIMGLLSTDDRLEGALRHIGAFVYERRTQGQVGATRMCAIGTPSTTRDVMPEWYVNDASAFKKVEFQRSGRINTEIRKPDRDDGGRDGRGRKGEGKGKDQES